MLLRLLLTCSILFRASAVCFGPCLEGKVYEIRPSRSSIEVECSRHYNSRTSSKGCITTMSNTWNLASASVNEFADMERAYEEEGRAGAELACEKVCARYQLVRSVRSFFGRARSGRLVAVHHLLYLCLHTV